MGLLAKAPRLLGVTLALLAAAPAGSLLAATEVATDVGRIELSSSVELLKDAEGVLDLAAVRSTNVANRFTNGANGAINLGYTSSVWWFRFDLANEGDNTLHRLIEIGYPRIDDISFFSPALDGTYDKRLLGDRYNFSSREIAHRNFVVPISLPPTSVQTFYLRMQTEDSLQFPLTLWTQTALAERDRNSQLVFGLYYGIAIAMVLYNLLLWVSVRDRNYLYYVAYILSYSTFQFASNGLGFVYLWPDSAWWASNSIHVFAALTIFFVCVFGRSFLRSRENLPHFDNLLLFVQLTGFVLIFVNVFAYSALSIRITVTGAGLVSVLLLGAGVVMLVRGYRPARFWVAGWSLFLTGVLVNAIKQFGVLPAHFLTEYGMQLGATAEMILLSFSLADRIKLLEQDRDTAQREALENLERMDRLKDEFLATTSHELRTPLHAIVATSEALSNRLNAPEHREDVELMGASARRLANMVDEILDFAQLKSHNMTLNLKPVGLRDLATVIVSLCQALVAEKKVELRNDIPEGLPAVLGDEDRLQQVLYDLAGNAIKFTDAGVVSLNARVIDDVLEISVEDTGVGIPKDMLQSIFEPFEQAGARAEGYGGAGLGLAVSRQLVELHGGSIRATSELGKGTTMTFTLPISQEDPQAVGIANRIQAFAQQHIARSTAQAETSADGRRILVVDDEVVNLRILTNQLSDNGYQVVTASSGEEALQILEMQPTPDLILLDIMMPGMSGYEVCQAIRSTYSPNELPVILVSARNRLSDLLTGLDSGANDYVEKPFRQAELIGRIRMHIGISTVHQAVSRFVPREFLEALNKDDILDVSVGDFVEREVTVLFADVRSFTSIIERRSPSDAIALLNRILGTAGPLVRSHNGFVAQFTGDGLEAIFPGCADDALNAAADLQEALQQFNKERIAQGAEPIRLGTGVHTGVVALGIVGEHRRMEGLAVSDVVNLAARVEGLTKWFGASVVFTETTHDKAVRDFPARYLGRVSVVGRQQPIGVFELRSSSDLANKETSGSRFESAINLYQRGRFTSAASLFQEIASADPTDRVAERFSDLCAHHEDLYRDGAWKGIDQVEQK